MVPPVHAQNDILTNISNELEPTKFYKKSFVQNLSNYIDSYFSVSNKRFCNIYSIPYTEFEPEELLTKENIMRIIQEEFEYRKKNPESLIYHFKKISGEWASFSYKSQLRREKSFSRKLLRKVRSILK